MRHRVAHRKLGRVSEHRLAMLRNQAQALLKHERIETTVPRAKELRPFVEHLITTAKRGLVAGAPEGKALHARRLVLRDLADKAVVAKLFDTIAPRFETRPGGYTRLMRVGFRRGDSAEVAQVELVGSEYDPKAKSETSEPVADKAPGVGGRIRAAASRLRGGKKSEDEAVKGAASKRGHQPSRTFPTKRGGS
jgi:large subunit ribosomal protein L17